VVKILEFFPLYLQTDEVGRNNFGKDMTMIISFDGKTPDVAETAYVSEAATIVGDVEIGENSSVWPGAVIRGDFGKIRIGRNTAVEDNCVLHAGSPTVLDQGLIIGDNVHIGHGAVVNGKKIGNHVLIGINASILHDVEIDDYCIIGAGCLVGHNMKIPERSFVIGIPGKIRGKVTEEQLFWVKEAPGMYMELVKKYRGVA
jgi:carbonic anhydrase/acetyltransferase-like protein (isoleucine patch superfamily)